MRKPKLRTWFEHIALSGIIGVGVLATSLVASWIQMREPGVGSMAQRFTRWRLQSLANAIQEHADQNEAIPTSLGELQNGTLLNNRGQIDDQWGNALVYTPTAAGYVLYSLGRDGKPGGVGLDADLYSDGRYEAAARLPFRQFVLDTETKGNLPFCAIFGFVCAMTFLVEGRHDFLPDTDESRRGRLLVAIGIVIGATLVAFLVTPLHIPSGH